jgi:hypothetical protein
MGMTTGKNALSEIGKALDQARQSLTGVDADYNGARNRLAKLRQQSLGLYAELARLRLVQIEQGAFIDELERTDREAAKILEEREKTLEALGARIESNNDELGTVEQRRTDQQTAVATASQALDSAEAEAQAALQADPAYQAQLKATDEADFVADQAEAKAAAALEDRVAKGKPYEDDALFAYLWRRGYGTSRYRAWPLTRWLDGKVARLCRFEPARQDYALLTEIPKRLAEHAAARRAAFDREAGALADLEEQAAAKAEVPERKAELESARQALDAIDADIASREQTLRELVEQRQRFAAGRDTDYARCIDLLSQAMQREGLKFLEQRAARTLERQDDEIVARLAELDEEADRIERNLDEFRRLHEIESNRVDQLEDIRRRFKSERYDDPLSQFKDWALIALVLREFLRGAARSNDVWRTIERQRRTRPGRADPNFGTLRFPRAPKHGPWRMPKGGFGGGIFKSGGGFKGGGFRTGGGFKGGGGFKSGGGF